MVLPIALFGIPDNYDVMEHMRFAVTYSDALQNGDFPALWSEKDNFGYGGAGVRLYPPFTYFLFSFIHLFTSSWHLSLTIVLLTAMFIGCLGVYSFTREYYRKGSPLLAAFIYGIIPYHLFQIYQLFLLAEFVAAGLTPFVFYYGTRLIKEGGVRNSVLFSIFFSLVVLTHIPSTIILSVSLAVFFLIQLRKETILRTAIYTSVSAVLTLLSTAFYWLKVVTEVKWVKHDAVDYYNSGLYTYSSYLFPIFLDPPDFFEIKQLWMFDIITGITLVVSILLGLYLVRKKASDLLIRAMLATLALSLFMATSLSAPIWNNIEFLQKLQFPWRWLSVAMVMCSFLCGPFIECLKKNEAPVSRAMSYLILAVSLPIAIFILTQIIIPMAAVSPAEFDRQVNGLGSTVGCKCWWPVWAEPKQLRSTDKVSAEGRNIEAVRSARTETSFTAESGDPVNVRIATFYYPYWTAEVNGSMAEVFSSEEGTILIPIPSERSDVRLFFKEPLFLRAAGYVSITIWLLLIITFLAITKRTPK